MAPVKNERNLVFFTSTFPYGTGETFIESELPFLAEAFDRIIIVTNAKTEGNKRSTPSNSAVLYLPYEAKLTSKIAAIVHLPGLNLKDEARFIQQREDLVGKASALKAALTSYAKALEVSAFLNQLVQSTDLPLHNLYLYSYWMNDMASGIALFKKEHPQVKAFCRAHGWDVYFERHQPPYLPLRNFILDNLSACFCISANGQKYVQQLAVSETARSKVRLARLGTVTEKALQVDEALIFRIVSCSGVIPLKRLHLIVDTLALIDSFEIEWIHFGSGPLLDSIQHLASEKLKQKGNVKVTFKGQTANVDIIHFYSKNSVSAFINVSETEGLPVSIMEAMSFGIPAIATNVGGVSEIVEHDKNGLLLSANPSVEEIASAINKLQTMNEAQRKLVCQNAYNTWNEKFNAEKNYSSFVQEILSL